VSCKGLGRRHFVQQCLGGQYDGLGLFVAQRVQHVQPLAGYVRAFYVRRVKYHVTAGIQAYVILKIKIQILVDFLGLKLGRGNNQRGTFLRGDKPRRHMPLLRPAYPGGQRGQGAAGQGGLVQGLKALVLAQYC
jgi:hypothetical protein